MGLGDPFSNTPPVAQTIALAAALTNTSPVAGAITGYERNISVRAASVEDLDLTQALNAMDGVDLAAGDVVLIKDQTDAEENGIYKLGATKIPSRHPDFDTAAKLELGVIATVQVVQGGMINPGLAFKLDPQSGIVLETTELTFTEMDETAVLAAPTEL